MKLEKRAGSPGGISRSSRVTKVNRCRILAVVLAVVLAGCVQLVVQQPWDPQGRYLCDDGKAFTVELRDGGASVTVTHEAGQVMLPQISGATDAKYSDGRTTLYLDGDRALLDVGGQVFARGCVKR
jgi:membrane-bound inhibitor of C-type lysozyme